MCCKLLQQISHAERYNLKLNFSTSKPKKKKFQHKKITEKDDKTVIKCVKFLINKLPLLLFDFSKKLKS